MTTFEVTERPARQRPAARRGRSAVTRRAQRPSNAGAVS